MIVAVEYDMIVVVKIYSYFYFLRINVIFCFVGVVLIYGCCLCRSL